MFAALTASALGALGLGLSYLHHSRTTHGVLVLGDASVTRVAYYQRAMTHQSFQGANPLLPTKDLYYATVRHYHGDELKIEALSADTWSGFQTAFDKQGVVMIASSVVDSKLQSSCTTCCTTYSDRFE